MGSESAAGSLPADPLVERRTRRDLRLASLLDRMGTVPGERLGAFLTDAFAGMGVHRVTIYLSDYEEQELRRFDGIERISIEGTMAGRAYQTLGLVRGPGETAKTRTSWCPLADGTDRLGVFAVLGEGDEDLHEFCSRLGAVLTRVLLIQGRYSDTLTARRRRQVMSLAAEIQWSLLPAMNMELPRIALAGRLEPAYNVGGDVFDYSIAGDTLHVAIFDAMGHGLRASMMASVAVGAYRNGRRRGADLVGIYRTMDQAVASQFGAESFVTAQFGTLDLRNGRLRWINAGHPEPLLCRDGAMIGGMASVASLPLGMGGEPAGIAEGSLQPGDRILFFTDGVTEGVSPGGEPFGEDRLADQLVRESGHGLPFCEVIRRVTHTVVRHQDGRLRDDSTMLLLEWRGPPLGPSDEGRQLMR